MFDVIPFSHGHWFLGLCNCSFAVVKQHERKLLYPLTPSPIGNYLSHTEPFATLTSPITPRFLCNRTVSRNLRFPRDITTSEISLVADIFFFSFKNTREQLNYTIELTEIPRELKYVRCFNNTNMCIPDAPNKR
jgi:hypothetical protein